MTASQTREQRILIIRSDMATRIPTPASIEMDRSAELSAPDPLFNRRIMRRRFLGLLACGVTSAVAACRRAPPAPRPLPATGSTASPHWLPRWRGFNLLEKFTLQDNQRYREWDFDFMAEFGFDFARLPCDYRIWTAAPGNYLEQPLREIDQAIAWARQRGIHVSLNLHRAPGYCVTPPVEPLSLWADDAGGDEARRQFADQWRMFAERYKGIPSSALSFNLLNEPPNIPPQTYLRAVTAAVRAIREADASRLIIADGLNYATQPAPELNALMVAQSMHHYQPLFVTHYRAEWVNGSTTWPAPEWPIVAAINQYLYGNNYPHLRSALVLQGDFWGADTVQLRIEEAPTPARLIIRANDTVVFDQTVAQPEVITAGLSRMTREIRFEVAEGDWLRFSEIRIHPLPIVDEGVMVLKPDSLDRGIRQTLLKVGMLGRLTTAHGLERYDQSRLWRDYGARWKAFADSGIGVHVGEWGVYRFTPHAVTLAFMRDSLDLFRQAGLGWALWNLRGSFGILDSDRADVSYERHRGRRLDRQMLELLRTG